MALEQAMVWHVWWSGQDKTPADVKGVTVELNSDFIGEPISMDDMVRLGLEVDAERMSMETYWYNLTRGERTIPGRTLDEELVAIGEDRKRRQAAMPPATDTGVVPDETMIE
jgi:hypothetical protein